MASMFSIRYQYLHPPLQKRYQIKITKFAAADLLIAAAFTFAVPTSSLADAITSSSDSSAVTENDIQAVIDGVSPVSRTAGYARTTTAEQNGITFTADWNDVPAGSETTFHVAQTEGSSSAKARMDVPAYWDAGERQEGVCEPTHPQWGSYYGLGDNGYGFSFELTASDIYRINFY